MPLFKFLVLLDKGIELRFTECGAGAPTTTQALRFRLSFIYGIFVSAITFRVHGVIFLTSTTCMVGCCFEDLEAVLSVFETFLSSCAQ